MKFDKNSFFSVVNDGNKLAGQWNSLDLIYHPICIFAVAAVILVRYKCIEKHEYQIFAHLSSGFL